MPEDTNMVEENATQGATAETERTFTQAELDAIVGDRLKRERSKYADYEELKGKAQQYDAAQEAAKSDLEKAVERANKLQARLDKIEAERARAEQVAKLAAEHGVDAEMLDRMGGDVEENALFLKEKLENAPKHGSVPDYGEAKGPAGKKATADQFAEAITIF